MLLNIRQAAQQDLDAITAIYNDAIINTTATFDTEPKTAEEQAAWFKNHDDRNVILVAEAGGKIAGWASLSRWSDRCAYADTAECSVYVDKAIRGQGVGSSLLEALTGNARGSGLHTLIARIAEGNEVSIRLCRKAGFQHIGTMKEVGRKFGKLLDVHLMQLMLGD